MGKRSRTKGASGEREVAALAVECGYPKAHRAGLMQSGQSEDEYADVRETGINWIECKRYRKVPVNAFAVEYLTKERPGYVPLLAWRDDKAPWFATVLLEDWLKLTVELETLRAVKNGVES